MRNLFIELHECRVSEEGRRFGSGWEDLFTEQLAFYFTCDPPAADALARKLLDEDDANVVEVQLQPSLEDGQPDLALKLDDERHVILEHKVEAALQPRQLSRYLRHGAVALVSRRNVTVPEPVFEHDGYLRPARGEHYTWEHIFRTLPLPDEGSRGQEALREAFRTYMRELGLAPSDLARKWRRLFLDRTEKENRRVQKEFGRLLNGVKAHLRSTWGLDDVQDVSHKGKQAYASDHAAWRHLYVYPRRLRAEEVPRSARAAFEPGYEVLAVEVVYDDDRSEEIQAFRDRLPPSFDDAWGHRWHRIGTSPIGRDRVRVTLATPLAPFFDEETGLRGRLDASATAAVDLVLNKLGLEAG